jgi:phosphoribosylformimino-5-aminoimidazole carboxamide ribotide isomerase
MRILPAIDIKDGKCVRLAKGDYSKVTHYFDNPLSVAKNWIGQGASSIHIVDLDGAKDGETINYGIIQKIRSTYPDIYIQIGGGIRSTATISKYLDIGINKLIIGTKALSDPLFLESIPNEIKDRIIIDLAVKNMKLAVHGWETESEHTIEDYLYILEKNNISEIVYTDVDKDGMLSGMNFHEMKKILNITSIPLIASGGVTSISDIRELTKISDQGVSGVIIGKALYENKINLIDIFKIVGN